MQTLRKGSRGNDVKILQRALNLYEDGIFGDLTLERVKEYQKSVGLYPDGVVGDKTWEKLLGGQKKALTGAKGMRTINRIFVHCTAGNQKTTTLNTLKNEFKARGWKVAGYHYVVFPNGNVIQMTDENVVANGVRGYNKNSIHVSWVGGCNSIDNRTKEQKESMVVVLKELKKKYPTAKILGHRDISPDLNHNGIVDPWERIKDCPCFDAIKEYKNI